MPWFAFDSHKHYAWASVQDETGKRSSLFPPPSSFFPLPSSLPPTPHSSLVLTPSLFTHQSSLSATARQTARFQRCPRNSVLWIPPDPNDLPRMKDVSLQDLTPSPTTDDGEPLVEKRW